MQRGALLAVLVDVYELKANAGNRRSLLEWPAETTLNSSTRPHPHPTAMSAKLSALLLVLAVGLSLPSEALVTRKTASPVTLPFARRLNFTGAANILQIDQARAKGLREHATTKPGKFTKTPIISTPATNQAVDYVATVSLSGLTLMPPVLAYAQDRIPGRRWEPSDIMSV